MERFYVVTKNDVLEIVKSPQNKFTYDKDDISTALLSKYFHLILATVNFIFINSLKYGIFPTEFKWVKIKDYDRN